MRLLSGDTGGYCQLKLMSKQNDSLRSYQPLIAHLFDRRSPGSSWCMRPSDLFPSHKPRLHHFLVTTSRVQVPARAEVGHDDPKGGEKALGVLS